MNSVAISFEMHQPVLDHVWRRGRKLLLSSARIIVKYADSRDVVLMATYGHSARKRR